MKTEKVDQNKIGKLYFKFMLCHQIKFGSFAHLSILLENFGDLI